jgi:hypothetical protein
MSWYWIIRYRSYRYHPSGIANYAAKAAALITADGLEDLEKAQHSVAKRLAVIKGMARLIHQKWNKLRDLGRPGSPFAAPFSPEENEDLHLRISRERWVLLGLLLGEGFLNYLSLMVIIQSEAALMLVVRVVIALVLTVVAFKVFHLCLDAWDPHKPKREGTPQLRLATAALSAFMLVSIAGVTVARARDFEGGSGGGIGIVGIGFIIASLILPVVGGAVDLQLGRIQPLHSRLRKWRAGHKVLRAFEGRIQGELTAIDDTLEAVTTRFKENASRMFAGVTDFRVAKNNLDVRLGANAEGVAGTAAESHDVFVETCFAPFRVRRDEYLASIDAEKSAILLLVRRDIETDPDTSKA